MSKDQQMKVPTSRDALRFFHGTREEWASLTDTEKRYVLVTMSPGEQERFMPTYPDLVEMRDLTRADLEREMRFRKETHLLLGEIFAFTEQVCALLDKHGAGSARDLPPEVLRDLERETLRLFGSTDALMSL